MFCHFQRNVFCRNDLDIPNLWDKPEKHSNIRQGKSDDDVCTLRLRLMLTKNKTTHASEIKIKNRSTAQRTETQPALPSNHRAQRFEKQPLLHAFITDCNVCSEPILNHLADAIRRRIGQRLRISKQL